MSERSFANRSPSSRPFIPGIKHICKHQIDLPSGLHELNGIGGAPCLDHGIAPYFQELQSHAPHRIIIFYNEDRLVTSRDPRGTSAASLVSIGSSTRGRKISMVVPSPSLLETVTHPPI